MEEKTKDLSTIPTPTTHVVKPEKKNFFKSKWVVLSLITLVLIIISVGTAYYFLNSNKQIACTLEAKLCPDGSSVGRTGPKCEFAACPNITPTPMVTLISTPKMVERVIWDVQKPDLTPTELEIKNAFSTYTVPSSGYKFAIVYLFVSSISADFAKAVGENRFKKDQGPDFKENAIVPTEGTLLFLSKVGQKWNIMTGADQNFCQNIINFPSDILTENLKTYMIGCFPR